MGYYFKLSLSVPAKMNDDKSLDERNLTEVFVFTADPRKLSELSLS